MDGPLYIVAEISKNWIEDVHKGGILSEDFEDVIAANVKRGYDLHSWRLSQVVTDAKGVRVINETIVAVFKKGV